MPDCEHGDDYYTCPPCQGAGGPKKLPKRRPRREESPWDDDRQFPPDSKPFTVKYGKSCGSCGEWVAKGSQARFREDQMVHVDCGGAWLNRHQR